MGQDTMSIGVIEQRKTTMKAFGMTIISVLILIGAVDPISLSELLAATTLTGSSVESIDSTGRRSER